MDHPLRPAAIVLGGFLGALVLGAMVVFCVVPYDSVESSFDRRRGAFLTTTRHYGIVCEEVVEPGCDLSRHGATTAPARIVVYQRRIRRFPWSPSDSGEYSLSGADDALQLTLTAFLEPGSWTFRGTPLFTPAELDAILAPRVPLWNSRQIDEHPLGVASTLRAENQRLRDEAMARRRAAWAAAHR
jgi:hypothetical protein